MNHFTIELHCGLEDFDQDYDDIDDTFTIYIKYHGITLELNSQLSKINTYDMIRFLNNIENNIETSLRIDNDFMGSYIYFDNNIIQIFFYDTNDDLCHNSFNIDIELDHQLRNIFLNTIRQLNTFRIRYEILINRYYDIRDHIENSNFRDEMEIQQP